MSDMMVIKQQVGDDGTVTLHLTPGTQVEITVKEIIPTPPLDLTPEEEAALDAEFQALINDPTTFTGLGLTAGEIAKSPAIGAWAHRTDIKDSVEFVNNMRKERKLRRANRNE
ncbi:MAG: hypothetical protein LCI00_17500 [Chloroflexi bacterium]|nr:hypothetical protein [Chloroflexota bacterium]MCC6896710.1 hypothetical protein [Anaerolineae bacterium]